MRPDIPRDSVTLLCPLNRTKCKIRFFSFIRKRTREPMCLSAFIHCSSLPGTLRRNWLYTGRRNIQWLLTVSEDESMIIMAGSRHQAGRLGMELELRTYIWSTGRNQIKSALGMVCVSETSKSPSGDIPPPTRLQLSLLSKQFHRLGTKCPHMGASKSHLHSSHLRALKFPSFQT